MGLRTTVAGLISGLAVCVAASRAETVTLSVVDGYDEQNGTTLASGVGTVRSSDDVRWSTDAGFYTSYQFEAVSLPPDSTITAVSVNVEHYEDNRFAAGSLVWRVGTGWPDSPTVWDSTTPALNLRERKEATDTWQAGGVNTLDRLNALELQVLNSDGRRSVYVDHVYLEVTYATGPLNNPPIALDDAYEVVADGDLNVAAPGVLGNDSDPDGDSLSVVLESGVTNGSLTLYTDGSFRYTPALGFVGIDSFTYRADDGSGQSNSATVTLSVPAERPYSLPDAELMNSNDFTQLPNFGDPDSQLVGRTDVAGPGVEYTVTLGASGDGKLGMGVPNWPISTAAGLDPDPGEPDGCQAHNNSSLAAYGSYEMTITYVAGPENSDIDVGLILNTGLTGTSGYPSGDWTNDTFWGGQWANVPVGGQATITLDFDSAEAWNIWDNKSPHTGGYLGWSDGGLYAINDRDRHEISNIGFQIADFDGDALGTTIRITLSPVGSANTPPVAVDDVASVESGGEVIIDVLANDTDDDLDTLAVQSLTQPTNGTAFLNADNTVTYTADSGFAGTDVFAYTVSDGNGGTDTAAVTVTVTEPGQTMSVASVTVSSTPAQKFYIYTAEVKIVDGAGAPLEGATVTVAWAGAVTGTSTGITGADGIAWLTSRKTKRSDGATATVVDVVKNGYTYVP